MKNNEPEQADNHFSRYLELQPDAADRGYLEHYQTNLKTRR
jgi:hypothetical protein